MKRSKGPRIVISLCGAVLLLAMAYAALPLFVTDPLPGVQQYERSPLVLDRHGEVMNVSLSRAEEWCLPVSLDRMGRWTADVAIAIEDKRFLKHRGVDVVAILRAAFSNLRAGRVVSGASTITTQLIRISDPHPRTYCAKLSEFARAIVLERSLGKEEILELYLNRAPFGGNLRGIEAASRAYFGKSASALSLAESTLLLSLLRAPSRLRPDRFPVAAREIRDRNLLYLAERGFITDREAEQASSVSVIAGRRTFPNEAAMAAAHAKERAAGSLVVHSTIDLSIQKILQQNMETALSTLPLGMTAAGIIIDNGTNEVLAYVGNARHGSVLPGAQVDCGDAPRSPGSTLKPFIYALAFEKGLLVPASLLADTPIAFRGSAPRNFDQSYRGPVSARTALASSLNAPAVRVLRLTGYAGSLQLLRSLGFSYLTQDSSHYYDSLILGGCETTLIELAQAYRCLANYGTFAPVTWNLGEQKPAKRVLSPAASYIAIDIMQDTRRLVPMYQEIMRGTQQVVGFKTGTSYGLRDAWSLGVTASYSVGIWFGSADGRGWSDLVGLTMATPVMLEVFKSISKPYERGFYAPERTTLKKFCALSGEKPGKHCPHIVRDYEIEGVSRQTICRMHSDVDGRIVIKWPEELSLWMKMGQPLRATGVKITRPVAGSRIVITEGNTSKLYLSAEGKPPFYWYLDGKYLARDEYGEGLLIDIGTGAHRVSVLSGEESDVVSFEASIGTTTLPRYESGKVLD